MKNHGVDFLIGMDVISKGNYDRDSEFEIDGSFGPLSDQALCAYQPQHGLEVDGKCGPATRACMQAD